MKWVVTFVLLAAGGAAAAQARDDAPAQVAATPAERVWDSANRIWPDMPEVRRVANMAEPCGAQGQANSRIFYCTSRNTVYIGADFEQDPRAPYEMAHVLGHAIQVRHGIADIALREIRNRPDEEPALRAMVTRQVECLAGFLVADTGLRPHDFAQFGYTEEPFTGSHWGRDPVRIGPRVSIGLQARAEAYTSGYEARDSAVCAVEEIPIGPILDARR